MDRHEDVPPRSHSPHARPLGSSRGGDRRRFLRVVDGCLGPVRRPEHGSHRLSHPLDPPRRRFRRDGDGLHRPGERLGVHRVQPLRERGTEGLRALVLPPQLDCRLDPRGGRVHDALRRPRHRGRGQVPLRAVHRLQRVGRLGSQELHHRDDSDPERLVQLLLQLHFLRPGGGSQPEGGLPRRPCRVRAQPVLLRVHGRPGSAHELQFPQALLRAGEELLPGDRPEEPRHRDPRRRAAASHCDGRHGLVTVETKCRSLSTSTSP